MRAMKFFCNVYWALALLFLVSERPTAGSVENASATASPVCEEDHDGAVIIDLIQWIKGNGGIVDDRQVVKRKDATSPRNVYATEFIPEGTVLLSVPWDLVLEPKDYTADKSDICDMVKVLHKELKANEKGESKYGPYMRYLESMTNPFMLPSAWSQGGKNLLKKVMGDILLEDPNEIDQHFRSWKKKCGNDNIKESLDKDPIEKAAHLVIGYDSPDPSDSDGEWYQMIPFYDVYSPREDEPNTDFEQDDDEEVMLVTASRDIEAGETIHTPMGFGEAVGDERKFIHSGVIERHHFFTFTDRNAPPKNKRMEVEFDLDVIEKNGEAVHNLTWTNGLRPHSRAYDHVERELGRMKQIVEILTLDPLYLLEPAAEHERKAIEAYSLALIDALSAVAKTRHDPRPVTPWTIHDYEVAGVNLGTYNLAGIEEAREPRDAEKPYELFEDFDISHLLTGNEQWKDMIEIRRQLDRPRLSFYVDKVARKRWLPTQGMPQAKQYVLKYAFELTETGDSEEEAEALFRLIPDQVDYAAKPSHHSEGVSVWLVSHDVDTNVTSFSSTARQLQKDTKKKFDKMNVAKALSKHVHAEAARDESLILRNVIPGVVVEQRMVEVDRFDRVSYSQRVTVSALVWRNRLVLPRVSTHLEFAPFSRLWSLMSL